MSTSGTQITGVDFVMLPTRDLERAVEFYRDTLGLACSVHMAGSFAEFEAGPLTLNVAVTEKFPMGYHVNHNPLALHVEDVASAREDLAQRGVSFAGDTFDTGVCHMAFFADPDGNPLMLHHRYAPRVTDA